MFSVLLSRGRSFSQINYHSQNRKQKSGLKLVFPLHFSSCLCSHYFCYCFFSLITSPRERPVANIYELRACKCTKSEKRHKLRKKKKAFYLFFLETFFLHVKEKKMDYFPRSIYLHHGLLSSQNWPMYENFVTKFVGCRIAQNQFNANIPKLFFLAKFRGRDSKSAQVSVFGRHIFPRSPQPDSR